MLNHGPTWESLIQAGLGGVSGLGVHPRHHLELACS